MEYCSSCKRRDSFKNGLCLQCSNYYLVEKPEKKSNMEIITKQRENEILLHSSPGFLCQCHNFEKMNRIISKICILETSLTKIVNELINLKNMMSECEIKNQ